MNPWNTILAKENAVVTEHHRVQFNHTTGTHESNDLLVIPLIDKEFLNVTGPDSKKFLQGQVTCDVNALGENNWFPGAICNPKGRMITSFCLYQLATDNLLMEMNPGLVNISLDAIKKYSAFFKTELSDASRQFCLIGLMGKSVNSIAEKLFNIPKMVTSELFHYQDCLVIPQDECRLKLLVPADKLEQLWQLCTSHGQPASNDHWKQADIQQGIGEISLPTSSELIPQMINLQARGGISFKKGCYTGQEIVARMKYLGKLKRHMYRIQIHSEILPEVAQPCYSGESSNNQGMVINVTKVNAHIEALVVLTDQLASEKQIGLGEQVLQPFEILPLPYSLE